MRFISGVFIGVLIGQNLKPQELERLVNFTIRDVSRRVTEYIDNAKK